MVTGLFFLNSSREGLKHYTLDVQPEVIVGIAQPPYTALQFISDNNQHVHAHSYAVFGEANYSFTPAWKFTLGGRFTKEDKAGHSEVYDTSGLSPDLAATYSHSWSAFNPGHTVLPAEHAVLGLCDHRKRLQERRIRYERPHQPGLGDAVSTGKSGQLRTRRQSDGPRQAADRQRRGLLCEIHRSAGSGISEPPIRHGVMRALRNPGLRVGSTFNALSWLTLMGNYSYMNAKYTRYVQGDGSYLREIKSLRRQVSLHAGRRCPFRVASIGGGEVRSGATSPTKGKILRERKQRLFVHYQQHPDFRSREPACELDVAGEVWAVSLWANNVNNKRYIINAVDLTAFYATVPEFLATERPETTSTKCMSATGMRQECSAYRLPTDTRGRASEMASSFCGINYRLFSFGWLCCRQYRHHRPARSAARLHVYHSRPTRLRSQSEDYQAIRTGCGVRVYIACLAASARITMDSLEARRRRQKHSPLRIKPARSQSRISPTPAIPCSSSTGARHVGAHQHPQPGLWGWRGYRGVECRASCRKQPSGYTLT